MSDLRLVMETRLDGLAGKEIGDRIASIARHCSIFLRKMVLGDRRTPPLLSDEFTKEIRLSFPKLMRIPTDRRTLDVVSLRIAGGSARLTMLDDQSKAPKASMEFPSAPMDFRVSVEWPLPGTASWLEQPRPESPWQVLPEDLFDLQLKSGLSCNRWLSQQLVKCGTRTISLGEVIREVVNKEGAHSPLAPPLMYQEGQEIDDVSVWLRGFEIHLLNHILLNGVSYSHLIVIETAIYLYERLVLLFLHRGQDEARVNHFLISFTGPEEVFGRSGEWLTFSGGLILPFGGGHQSISYTVSALG